MWTETWLNGKCSVVGFLLRFKTVDFASPVLTTLPVTSCSVEIEGLRSDRNTADTEIFSYD